MKIKALDVYNGTVNQGVDNEYPTTKDAFRQPCLQMLKKEVNIIKLIKFVRALTPATHPLAVHGWTAQPDHVLKLPNPINLPT